MRHDFIKTGDPDSHRHIEDRNGEVCLDQCRRCGQAEGELTQECIGAPETVTAATITDAQCDLVWRIGRDTGSHGDPDLMHVATVAVNRNGDFTAYEQQIARMRCAEFFKARHARTKDGAK